jgi:ribosomal protein L35AE/L33A
MDPTSLKKLQEHLQKVKAATGEEISSRLVIFPDVREDSDLTFSFYLVQSTTQDIREKELAEFLVDKIVRYVLKREDIVSAGSNPDLHSKNVRVAKAKFIHGQPTREVGELLLFLLLESRGIIQVLSKMGLKTNTEMYYHGVDAVHIEVTENVIFHLGSSKMKKDFGDAVKESLSDMEAHAKSIKRQDTEINLLSSYIDDSKFEPFTEFIRSVVDPYSSNRRYFGEAFSMLVCSDFAFLKTPYNKPAQLTLGQFLSEQFRKEQSSILSKITASLPSYPHVNCKPTHFYVVPFANVADFCQLFSEVLKS